MVLGRNAIVSGLNCWLDPLKTRSEKRYAVLSGLAESSENKVHFSEMTYLV